MSHRYAARVMRRGAREPGGDWVDVGTMRRWPCNAQIYTRQITVFIVLPVSKARESGTLVYGIVLMTERIGWGFRV